MEESPNKRSYKYCIVPECKSTSVKTPTKIFITVPRDPKRNIQWQVAMERKAVLSVKSVFFVCEDHFDLETDMENYLKFKLMGNVTIKMRPGVVPHIFNCQKNRTATHSIAKSRETYPKRQRRTKRKQEVDSERNLNKSDHCAEGTVTQEDVGIEASNRVTTLSMSISSQPSTSSSSPSIDPFIKEEPSCSREEEPGFAPTLELLPEQTEQPHLGMATRSFKGNKDKMYCRLCLKPAYKNSLTPLSVVDFNYPGKNDAFKKKKLEKVEEINKMLKFCLPFFNSLTFNPIICSICLGRLKIAYEFSKECLKTQRLIEKYAETYGTTEKVINLNEMIETEFELFNDENISDTETNISGIPKPMRSSGRLREKRQYSKEDSPPAKKLKDYHETHEEDSLSSSNDDASNIKMEPDDEDSCALTDSVKMEPAEDNSSYMERLIQDIPKNYITDSNKIDEETIIKVEPNDIDCPDFIKIEPVDELHIESKVFNERTGIGIDIAEQHSEFQGVENVSLNTAKAPLNARGAVFPHVGSSLEDTTSDVIK